MFAALLPILSGIAGKVIDRVVPDEGARAQAKEELTREIVANAQEIENAAASIVRTEAASQHWLAANWRPLTMLTFVGLIVARWMGWAAPGMSEAEYLSIYDIIQIGLGGYVASRGLEKITPHIADAIKNRR